MGALLRHHLVRHRLVLLLVVTGLAAFHFLFTRIAPSPEEVERFGAMLAFLPAPVRSALGLDNIAGVTSRGVIAFGYVHPFTILLLSLWTVRVTAAALAGEIGERTMDLLAARPVSRAAQVAAAGVAVLAGLALAVSVAYAGTSAGLMTRDLGGAAPSDFVRPAASLALLFAAWAGVALAVSAASRRGGGAIGIVSGVMALTFALDYIGRMYAPLGAVRWVSPFTYFAPHQSRHMAVDATGIAVLAGLAVAGFAIALLVFRRRDL